MLLTWDHCFLVFLCVFVLGRAVVNIYWRLACEQVRVNVPPRPGQQPFAQKRVHDFWVTSSRGEQRVRDFYAWLDGTPAEMSARVLQRCSAYNFHNNVKLSAYQVRKLLYEMYREDSTWNKLHVRGSADYEFVQLWLKLVEDTYLQHVTRLLAQFEAARKQGARVRAATRLVRELILFSDVITHTEARFADSALSRTVYRKLLELSASTGFLPALLTLGHLKPELVCDDCYPVLNNDTEVYRELVALEDLVDDKTFGPLVTEFEEYIIL